MRHSVKSYGFAQTFSSSLFTVVKRQLTEEILVLVSFILKSVYFSVNMCFLYLAVFLAQFLVFSNFVCHLVLLY